MNPLPEGDRNFIHRNSHECHTGRVASAIEMPECGYRGIGGRSDLILVHDVDTNELRATAVGRDGRHERLAVLYCDVGHSHGCASFHRSEHNGPTDPVGTTGHDD